RELGADMAPPTELAKFLEASQCLWMSEQERLAAQTRPFSLKRDISIPDEHEELIKATTVSCNSTKVTTQTEHGQVREDQIMQQNPLKSDFIEDMAVECFASWMICMCLPSSLWGSPTPYKWFLLYSAESKAPPHVFSILNSTYQNTLMGRDFLWDIPSPITLSPSLLWGLVWGASGRALGPDAILLVPPDQENPSMLTV
uniref:Uncharacterized protein n=1 Tax=Pavo cristatus TaxID=9049 RepID=A0A8C9EU15_PAVCR